MKKILIKRCRVCRKVYRKQVNTSRKNWRKSKYCSQKCLNKTKIGNTYKTGISYPAWNKGVDGPRGEDSPSWKGDKAGYSAKHKWIESILGRPDTCEHCGRDGLSRQQIHWANIDHQYRRILKDWMRLCASCHLKHDRNKFK